MLSKSTVAFAIACWAGKNEDSDGRRMCVTCENGNTVVFLDGFISIRTGPSRVDTPWHEVNALYMSSVEDAIISGLDYARVHVLPERLNIVNYDLYNKYSINFDGIEVRAYVNESARSGSRSCSPIVVCMDDNDACIICNRAALEKVIKWLVADY